MSILDVPPMNPANVNITGGSIGGNPVVRDVANITPQNLRKWRAALAKAITGNGRAKIACVGDSITVGSFATTDAWTNIKVNNWPTALAKMLSKNGFPATAGSFFGDSYRGSIAQQPTVDPRIAVGSGWILNGDTTFGGNSFSQSASGGNFSFTPTGAIDTFDVYYVNQTGNGVLSANIDGGTASTVNTGTQGPIGKLTLTTPTIGQHTANISWSSGGQVVLVGIEGRNSTSDLISIFNGGMSGSTAAQWISFSSGQPWTPLTVLQTLAPDLTIVSLGTNEWLQGISPAVYQANLQTVVAAGLVTGDVICLVEPPSVTTGSAGSFAPTAVQQGIIAAMYAVAKANNLPVIDITQRWTSFAVTSPFGFYGDNAIHPNMKGYADIASSIAQALNLKGYPLEFLPVATSASIGGSALTAGQAVSATVNVTGATVGMAVAVSPSTYPGDGVTWGGYVSAPGVVTVKITGIIAVTPTASTYNVRVIR